MAGAQRFVSFDGTHIAYQTWGPEGNGVPVVLQHGFAVDANLNWVTPGIVNALVDAGHWVVALDSRGHGQSDKPHDPERYGEEKMARDLVGLLDLIGARRVDLVGYSMGGIVALIVASHELRLRRLIVGGIGASAAELGGVDSRVRPAASIVKALAAEDPQSIDNRLAAAFRFLADSVGADREALVAQAMAAHAQAIPLHQIAVPTLVLVGEDDVLAPRPEVLANAIPDARLQLVPGDHLAAVATPQFTAAILKFLA